MVDSNFRGGGVGVIQSVEVISTSLGPLAEIPNFVSVDIHHLGLLPDTSDASTSSSHQGTETRKNNSAASKGMHDSLPPYLQTIKFDVQ